MGDKTSISWTDATWGPVRGCSRVSTGCERCYAEGIAARFSGSGQPYEGLAKIGVRTGHQPKWTGIVRLVSEHLHDPLAWRKPRRIFVTSMSDIFHEKLTNEEIAAVFGVMAAASHHTFQVLTKRAQRMHEWVTDPSTPARVERFRHIASAGRIEEFFAAERTVDIADWPGYAISSKGRVISSKRGGEIEMRVQTGDQGHGRVQLYRGDGSSERVLVHRLVLEAFDRDPKDDEQGCHIDGDATNNALWNLRWGSQASNWDDRKRHGNRRSYAKLNDGQVAELRRLAAEGVNGAELGRRFGISDTQARNIIAGRQWTEGSAPEWPLACVWLGVSVENQAAADGRIPLLLETPAAVRFLSCEPLLGPVHLHSGWMGGDYLRCINWLIAGCESGRRARPCDVAWLRLLRDQCAEASVPFFLKQATENLALEVIQPGYSHPIQALVCGPLSKRKGGGVIELPYLDGVQHAEFPTTR